MAASAPSTPTDLDWLADALWPQTTPQIVHGHRSSGLRFVANPHRAQPRLLVPADSPRAAAQSVRRYHDGASPAHRLKMGFTEAALRIGGARFLRSRRITIEPGPGPGLVDLVADRLERPIARFAVTLGPPRPNRKPVLQLFDERGATIGFAKVSVDPFTDELVRRESTWLELAHRHRDPALRVPAVVWSGEIGDRFVSVVAPTWARRRPPSDPSPPPALVSAIHHISTPVSAPALASAPARALLGISDGRAEEALGLLSIPDGHRSALGAWHGDLTPWNLLTTTSSRVVLDWESAEAGHPLGADLLHHLVAVGMELRGRAPADALSAAVAAWPSAASGLGLGEIDQRVVEQVLALEYVRRDLDLEAADRPVSGLGAAAIARLRSG